LISVFPYSGFLVVNLIDSVNEENAGRYAGLIASSFMMGRAVTSVLWGNIADTYGRRLVLHVSLLLSCFFSVLFGFAPTFLAAVLIRFCLGLSNGIMLAIKTIVSELTGGDEKRQTRMMSLVMGVWGFGFLVSPAISGALAEPLKQYPDMLWVQEGMLGRILQKYPFLLPNLVGAVMCIISAIMLALFVPETLPKELRRSPSLIMGDTCRLLGSCIPCSIRYQAVILKEHDSAIFYKHDSDLDSSEHEIECSTGNEGGAVQQTTMTALWQRKDTRRLLCLHWAYSFVGLTVDEVFPLFCMSHQAGFGIPEKEIGKVLSLCGLIFIICQYPVYSFAYNRFGLVGSIQIGSIFAAPAMFFVPLSLLLNKGADPGRLKWETLIFLGGVMAVNQVFSFVFTTRLVRIIASGISSKRTGSLTSLTTALFLCLLVICKKHRCGHESNSTDDSASNDERTV
jgi:MFS family permease